MSQGILFNGILTRIGTRSDGSLGITLESGEFTAEEKLAIFALQNLECQITFQPNGEAAPPREVRSELGRKTNSERIRAVLFCYWKHVGEPGNFEMFYNSECEKVINNYKSKLPPP